MQSAPAVCRHDGTVWDAIVAKIKLATTRQQYATWFRNVTAEEVADGGVVLGVPSEFHLRWISGNYGEILRQAVQQVCGPRAGVELRVLPPTHPSEVTPAPRVANAVAASPRTRRKHAKSTAPSSVEESPAAPAVPRQVPADTLTAGLDFERFVVDDHNHLAAAATRALATDESCDFSLLLLQGGVGLGKTHLLQAACRAAQKRLGAGASVLYVRAENFINDFVTAVATQRTQEFRQRYRSADFACFDDLHLVAHKARTQSELLHTLIAWRDRGARVAFAATGSRGDRLDLEDAFDSILRSAFRVHLHLPDSGARRSICQQRARDLGVTLPEDVGEFLAALPLGNVREVEGAVTRSIASARLTGMPLTLRSVRAALQDDVLLQRPISSPDRIVRTVCEHFEVTSADLSSRRRPQALSFARQVAMYLLRERTELSLSEIGSLLGGRDHTTVLHGIRRIEEARSNDRRLQEHLTQLRARLDH